MDQWRASVSYEEILELLEAHLRKKGVKKGRIIIHVDADRETRRGRIHTWPYKVTNIYATVEN